MEHGIIFIRFDHSRRYGIFCNTLRLRRVHITHAHRYAKLHGMKEFAPFGDVTVIQILQFTKCFGRKVFILFQHFIGLFQLLQHLRIYLFLRIVWNGQVLSQIIITQHLRVRDRSVNIRHTVHDADTQDFTQSQSYRIIRHAQHLEVLGIKVSNRIGKRGFQPSLFGVECRELHYPCIYDTFHIASVSTAHHSIHKLVQMLARRTDKSLHHSQRCADDMIFALHFIIIRFIHLAVYIAVETTGQG